MSLDETTGLHDFQDILRERRNSSDFLWVSRNWDPPSVYVKSHKSNSNQIKASVLQSQYLSLVIEELSSEKQIPVDVLYRTVHSILDEVGYERVVPVLRWLAFFTTKLLKTLCSAVLINEVKILRIKSQMGKNPVLFVPSHRSYGDFILTSYISFHYDMEIPRTAAGMDFHAMTIMGRIIRDACAFFMRRSFTADRLYTTTFSQYVNSLITNGDGAVEFFIEGTRSRTAKSLVPKYGFLTMAVKPFLMGVVPDITILPINLSYDRVLEEILFVYELLGVPKPKESTKGFFKALSILNEKYGNAYVQFGEPFSVREYFRNGIDRSLHNFGPVQLQEITPAESKQIIRLARSIVRQQQNLTILTGFNLIATIINHHIMMSCNPLTFDDLVFEMEWLLPVMRGMGARVAVGNDILKVVGLHLNLHKSLVTVTSDRKIKLLRIHSINGEIDLSKMKGHCLSSKTMDIAVPLLLIQYYSNPCAHFVVNLAFILLIVKCVSNGSITKDELFSHFKFLRQVFSNEFVLYPDTEEQDFERYFELAEKCNAIVQSGSYVALGENRKLCQFSVSFCRPYIPSYNLLIDILMKENESVLPEKRILKAYQADVETSLTLDSTIHPSSLCLDLAVNALQSLVQMGAGRKIRREEQTTYEFRGVELEKISNKLRSYNSVFKTCMEVSEHFSNFMNGKL